MTGVPPPLSTFLLFTMVRHIISTLFPSEPLPAFPFRLLCVFEAFRNKEQVEHSAPEDIVTVT